MKFMNSHYLQDASLTELLWMMKECINVIESKYTTIAPVTKNNLLKTKPIPKKKTKIK